VLGSLHGAAALVSTGLRGLRSRWLLTLGSILLAAIATAAAVVGPMYQTASAASSLVTNLRAQPAYATGESVDYVAPPQVGGRAAEEQATGAVNPVLVGRFTRPELSLWSVRLPVMTPAFSIQNAQVRLLAEPGVCQRLVVQGRCPTRVGEMLMLQSDAASTKTRLDDRVAVQGVQTPLTVVGTYRLRTSGPTWFDPTRFTSVPRQHSGLGYTPYYPAPFIVTSPVVTALRRGDSPLSGPGTVARWFVRMDYRLRMPPSTTLADLEQAVRESGRLPGQLASRSVGAGKLSLEPGNALSAVVRQADARQVTARQTVLPAVLSLILVGLVLLVRLLSAATELRRPELALASLRGIGRRQLWVLGMLEPVLLLVAATPIGVALGYLAGRSLAATWLVPGLPVPLRLSSVWFALGVLLASVLVAALTVRSATDEPLSVAIAGVRRPARPGRWGVLLRLGLVAAAVVVLASTLWSGKQTTPNATELVLPILLALAAGLLTTLAAAAVARWWARRSARRRGVAGYVASRTIARRREGTWVILPLTAALAIAVFAAGVYSAAANWRSSEAATMVGADVAYPVKLPLPQALTLTHTLDPRGKWLMAAGSYGDPAGEKVIVDAPRLARVAVWPASWTPGLGVAQIGRAISPTRQPLTLSGRRLQMTVDNQAGGASTKLLVSLQVVTGAGQTSSVFVGPFHHGRATRSAGMGLCRAGCQVTGMTISGPGTLPQVMRGTVRISGVRVDGSPLPYFFQIGWRPDSDPLYVYGAPSVTSARSSRSALTARLDTSGKQEVALLAPQDVARVLPVLTGRTAALHVLARHGAELTVATSENSNDHLRRIGTTESTPFLGPAATLVDATTYLRTHQLTDAETAVYILARGDTPSRVVAGLAAHGITQRITLQGVRHTLDQDTYALALNLYLVVTVLVILLAFAGLGVNMAVQTPARRRDAASLRVVGLRRRSLVTAVAAELTAALGTAALAGILAGALAQYVVVRTVTLGYADTTATPRVLPSLNVGAVVVLLVVAFAVLLCLAVVLASVTIRGARTATLREAAG
jgi:putative ABC transport system permease protein